ncbi:MAG: hemolysin family protein [Acidobacteriota bacterium]
MSWLYSGTLIGVLLAAGLFFLCLIVNAGWRLSRVSLRALAEKQSSPSRLLERVAADRSAFLLPLELAIHALQAGLTLLALLFFQSIEAAFPVVWALGLIIVLNALLRELLPKMIVQSHAEAVLLRGLRLIAPLYPLLRWLSAPLWRVLERRKESNAKDLEEHEEEAGEEAIQAYLGVGTEEGIFEQEESRLIQSALEFGNTLVREIMTPRTEIVAIEKTATMARLRELLVTCKHSRLPVYRDGLDDIVGIVYIRNFLGRMNEGDGKAPITPLIQEALFVPETKRVSELLRELQLSAANMTIVINEYGAVTGLVTTEDLVEELVGEIHDEDEQRQILIEQTGEDEFAVRGSVEIDDLEEALDIDLGETDVATISGLVVSTLGKVPMAGEKFTLDGIAIEIVESDRRKINKLQIQKISDEEKAVQPKTAQSSE